MQASVHRYDPHAGAVLVTDDGRTVAVPAAVLATAGLRTLRIGQRLEVIAAGGSVTAVRIPGLPVRAQPARAQQGAANDETRARPEA